jgi:phage shock protein A
MWHALRRRWRYFTARLSRKLEEGEDPKIQLEQAMTEAQDQHRRLVEQAANVIANQKQTELQLNRAMQELDKVGTSTRQALLMAQQAVDQGDPARAQSYNQTAEVMATRLIATEKRVNELKTLHLQATQAADQAKSAVQQNAMALQQRLAERQKLLSQLDQARMQEQLNRAMSTLSETVGQDVPTFDEVRNKIEIQYARALGTAELHSQSVEARMLEIERATVDWEAQARLDQIRGQLGLGAPGAPSALGSANGGAGTLGSAAAGAGALDPAPPATPTAQPAPPPPARTEQPSVDPAGGDQSFS